MKDSIFIVWSGENGQQLALQTKKKLQDTGYYCIIGGEGGVRNGMHIGSAIINQMKNCTQAIIIVQKKENGFISNNLFFEWGFLISHLGEKNVHVYYIDIDIHDDAIPSDLGGIWVNYLKGGSITENSEEIVSSFLEQKVNSISRDKMSVIDLYYTTKDRIVNHCCQNRYCEIDLAIDILFFAQSAYLFSKESDALGVLRDLDSQYSVEHIIQSPELDAAIDFSNCYLNTLNPETIQRSNNVPYLTASQYSTTKRILNSLIKRIQNTECDKEFSDWFFMYVYDALNYICILYSFMPECPHARKTRVMKESLHYAEETLRYCNILSEQAENIMCLNLYESYMYKNISTAYSFLSIDDPEKYTPELTNACRFKSLKKRSILFDHYSNRNINSRLLDKFELEYYLSLSEILSCNPGVESINYEDITIDCDEALINCEEYLDNANKKNKDKNYLLHQMQQFIENVYQKTEESTVGYDFS